MDNSINLNPDGIQGLDKLSAKDKQELNQFVVQEGALNTILQQLYIALLSSPLHPTNQTTAGQKAQIQQTVHQLTDLCFRK